MPKVSKETATREDHGPVVEWLEDLGGYTVNWVSFQQDIDSTPLLEGLPTTAARARTGATCSRAA
jgi:hypothetical protein